MKTVFKIILLSMVLFATSCVKEEIYPDDIVEEERLGLGNFDMIKAESGVQVDVFRGGRFSVFVEAPEELQRYIFTQVRNGELQIGTTRSIDLRDVHIEVTLPRIYVATALDGAEILSKSIFDADTFKADADNGGHIVMGITTDELTVFASAQSDVELYGGTDALFVDELSGNSRLFAFDLKTNLSDLKLSGASEAQVTAARELRVVAIENSLVRFRGFPLVTQTLSGGSRVVNAN